jgi:hypothetical protein
MNVLGLNDQDDDNHAFGLLCPLFHHQKAINKRRDRHPDEACPIDEQLRYALITAVRDRTIDKVHDLDKRTFAAGTKLADPFDDCEMLQHWRPLQMLPNGPTQYTSDGKLRQTGASSGPVEQGLQVARGHFALGSGSVEHQHFGGWSSLQQAAGGLPHVG